MCTVRVPADKKPQGNYPNIKALKRFLREINQNYSEKK